MHKHKHKKTKNFDPCVCACVEPGHFHGKISILMLALVLASLMKTELYRTNVGGSNFDSSVD